MYCTLLNGTMGSITDVVQCMPSGFFYLTAFELSALLAQIKAAGSAASTSSSLTVAWVIEG